jgi:hypothetical protein
LDNAVLTFPAHTLAVSAFTTATVIILGDPEISAEVIVTFALPVRVIVPTAVAVSAC